MTNDDFLSLINKLTGRPVHGTFDKRQLNDAVANDLAVLDHSQFNELLLHVNKDRVEHPFFKHFFGDVTTIGELSNGVRDFQIKAMLRYGNFIHAFKTWSRISQPDILESEMAKLLFLGEAPESVTARKEPLIQIVPIPREDTYFIGEVTSATVIADEIINESLIAAITTIGPTVSWETLIETAKRVINENHHTQLIRMIQRFRSAKPNLTVADFKDQIEESAESLGDRVERCKRTMNKGKQNLDVYLAWDHMDVYIATSMRERHDFESVHRFAEELINNSCLQGKHEKEDRRKPLKLRFFDPTQSKARNRVNKGLVEALMLKRSFCTIYSVQDSDTLGKDSELATTLAQGKPVIAYIPKMDQSDVETRKQAILDSDVSMPYKGYSYLCHSVEKFKRKCEGEYAGVISELRKAQMGRFWDSEDVGLCLRSLPGIENVILEKFAESWAIAEQSLYDKRANMLNTYHPLAFQVDLETGVANGLLIARSVEDCAKLVYAIALKRMKFYIDYDDGEQIWYLRDEITKSPFRVVTASDKLTNCFWNFYLRKDGMTNEEN